MRPGTGPGAGGHGVGGKAHPAVFQGLSAGDAVIAAAGRRAAPLPTEGMYDELSKSKQKHSKSEFGG